MRIVEQELKRIKSCTKYIFMLKWYIFLTAELLQDTVREFSLDLLFVVRKYIYATLKMNQVEHRDVKRRQHLTLPIYVLPHKFLFLLPSESSRCELHTHTHTHSLLP